MGTTDRLCSFRTVYHFNNLAICIFDDEKFVNSNELTAVEPIAGLEIATDTVANASTTFNLATKNSSFVATLATMFV